MVSFRGQKSLGHAQIGLLQGFNSKLPTRIRTPFVCSAPPQCPPTAACFETNAILYNDRPSQNKILCFSSLHL